MSQLCIDRDNKMREINNLRDSLDIAKSNKDAETFTTHLSAAILLSSQ